MKITKEQIQSITREQWKEFLLLISGAKELAHDVSIYLGEDAKDRFGCIVYLSIDYMILEDRETVDVYIELVEYGLGESVIIGMTHTDNEGSDTYTPSLENCIQAYTYLGEILKGECKEEKQFKIPWNPFSPTDKSTHPCYSDRYLVRRGGKTHFERWNGSGWAYNHTTITRWAIIQ